jgi:hypothetical protein
MNPKKIKSVLAVIILLTSFASFGIQAALAVHDPDDYIAVQGVLTTDTYDFYPYENLSVDFGFSKYGENIYWSPGEWIGLGIQYPGFDEVGEWEQYIGSPSRDPFGSELINKDLWLNGWFMEVRYTHRSERDRRLLAMAMFADMTASGGEWINGFQLEDVAGNPRDFTDSPFGGRKTTGYAETEDPVVLYDGPRRYIVETLTHVYDWQDGNGNKEVDLGVDAVWGLVDVKLTYIFNKVKKQVIILKDIKQVIDGKELDSPLDIQFSNREEWDLGPHPDFASYAHFWHQYNETCYGPDWHMAPGIMREVVNETTWDGGTETNVIYTPCIPEPQGEWDWPAVEGSVRLYINDVFQERGIARDYEVLDFGHPSDPRCDGLELKIHPREGPIEHGDLITVVFKVWKYHGASEGGADANLPLDNNSLGVPHLYDLVQIISEDMKYVGWKAYWPVLSDFTPDGWAMWWDPLIWVAEDDMSVEPDIPFTIGEWDFMLGKGYPPQFRGVEVVGLTDFHHASDDDMPNSDANTAEWEMKYLLEEVFNPWDLEKVTHKPTKTWVEWVDGATTYQTNHRPFAYWQNPDWGLYNDAMGNKVFSERVWDLTTGELLLRFHDYGVDVNPAGFGVITGLDSSHDYKIMYHTMPDISGGFVMQEGVNVNQTFTVEVSNCTQVHPELNMAPMWDDRLGELHGFSADFGPLNVCLNSSRTFNMTTAFRYMMDVEEFDFKVYKENENYTMPGWHVTTLDDDEDIFPEHTVPFEYGNITMDIDLNWYNVSSSNDLTVTWPMEGETLHVNELIHKIMAEVMVEFNGTHLNTITMYEVNVTYDEMLGGRYEHTVVGKDAASVDSIGAALVTAAFKNKQIEIGIGSLDMEEPEIFNAAPYVMRRFGDGMALPDYYHMAETNYDSNVNPLYPTTMVHGFRTSVMDDWCHTWQISGANLITVGGPGANVLTYYANDFANAIYGHPVATETIGSPWLGRIAAVTCWNKNNYSSFDEEGVGYAVISTYHDINGTTILSIWGHFGRDTYYASRFFHEELIEEFQTFDPCITDVILRIDYDDPKHPTFDIVEVLGTISEHNEWEENWDARAFMVIQDEGGLNGLDWDYMYTYAGSSPDSWVITKGGIHDP